MQERGPVDRDCGGYVVLTVKDLLDRLTVLSMSGYNNSRVLFDTDAACYQVHLVEVSGCHLLEHAETPLVAQHAEEPPVVLTTPGYHGRCELPEKDELPEVGNKATILVLRAHRPPESFFAWAKAEVKACENSGWKDDAYVGAGFRLGELREYLKRVDT